MSLHSTYILFLTASCLFFASYMVIHQREQGVNQVFNGVHDDQWPSKFDGAIVSKMQDVEKNSSGSGVLFHVALSASGNIYNQWQSSIMYYWYKKMKNQPGSDMGEFTRILHDGKPDDLMNEIPTFIVDPLPEGQVRNFIVLNRPWAFVQWLQKATIKEEYIMMAEPDHMFLKPLPNFAKGDYPVAFPFSYMEIKKFERIIRRYYPEEKGSLTNVYPIGSSPVIIKKSQLEEISATWMNVSLRMKSDKETDRTFGWLLEMYAYAVASSLHGVKHILREDLMIQPPFDHTTGKTYILHYTYACDYNMKGQLTYGKTGEWSFNKRMYGFVPPPRNLPLPPPGVPESVVKLIEMVNEATSNIDWWTKNLDY